jgi:hypothetical protein
MFDVNKKTITIKDISYEIGPLSGKYLAKLYSMVTIFHGVAPEDMASRLDEKTANLMHEICLESLRSSYITEPLGNLDLFVSQNLLDLFVAVVEINLGQNVKPK